MSLFEPHTEIIRKGKASKPNEFGNMVKVQEAENQIFTHYAGFYERHLQTKAVTLKVPKLRILPFETAIRTTSSDLTFTSAASALSGITF